MDSDETLKQEPTNREVFSLLLQIKNDVSQINKRLDAHDAQFEAIRQGLVDNSVAFHRLSANVHSLNAEVSALVEEVRHNRKVLV